jgi:putative ABC transport system permease protein
VSPRRDLVAALSIVGGRRRAWSGSTAVFLALVGITTLLAVALPRVYAGALDDAIRRTVAEVDPVTRDLQLTRAGSIGPGPDDDPLHEVRAEGAALDATMPDSVRGLLDEGHAVVDSVEFVAHDPPVTITHVKLRIHDGLADRIRYVEGRPPGADISTVDLSHEEAPFGRPVRAVRYEVALSTPALGTLSLAVGDELRVTPDDDDPIVERYRAQGSGLVLILAVVGRFEVVDPADPYWSGDVGIGDVVREPIGYELSIFHATALLDPGAYPALVGAEPPDAAAFPVRYAWRRSIDPDRLQAAGLPTLTADVTRLLARYPFSGTNTIDAPPSLRWGMLGLLERHDVQQRTASVTLALVALGPIATALGALALVALLVVRRRAPADAVIRSRGASTLVLGLAALVEALVLVVPVVAVGAALGWALTAGRSADGVTSTALVVAVATVAVLLAVALPGMRGPLRDPDPARARTEVSRAARQRRLVVEGTVLVLAMLAAAALRSRGAGDGQGPVAVDPLLAAVPVLVALAAGLVLLRLYPLPLRALAAIAARGRGFLPTFPLWGAARHSRLVTVPLLVILVATAMGAFSAAILETVREGQAAAAWRSVGADWRLDGDRRVGVPGALDPLAIAGVQAATGLVQTEGRARTEIARRAPVRIDAIDPPGLAAVLAGGPLSHDLTIEMIRTDWGPQTGTDEDPIPVQVDGSVVTRAGAAPGTTFFLTVAGIERTAVVVGLRDALPGSPTDEPVVTAPLGALVAAFPEVRWYPTSWLVRGGPDIAPAILEAVAPYEDLVVVRSRQARFSALRDAPVVTVVQDAVRLAIGLAAVYAGLALLAGLTLAIGTRRRDLHVLRTLGLSSRGLAGSIVIEQVPLVLVAVVGGAAVGVLIAWILGPSVGLEAYADGGPALPVAIDPVATLVVGLVPTLIGVVAVIAATLLARRADLAGAVRFHDAP